MIFVLLPAYNEENSLDTLIPKIDESLRAMHLDYKLIIVNDGSNDRTANRLAQFSTRIPMEILTHSINRGLGETSRDMFEKAAKMADENDILIRMDCDDTHDPKYMKDLIRKIEDGYDVVICSRFQPGGGQTGVPPYRAFISRCAQIYMKILFYIPGIYEYSCGYRAYRANMIQKAIRCYGNNFIQLKGLGFTCTLEKLIKLKMIKARFTEIPFVLQYDQKKSSSKMLTSTTTIGYLIMALFYHWPWSGWRRSWKKVIESDNINHTSDL